MTRQKIKNPSLTTPRQVVLQSAQVDRQERLLSTPPPTPTSTRRARLAEVAGASTAECAAIWCCCPCVIADFFVLAVYRVPAGLCRRAMRKRRRRRRLTRQVAFTSNKGVRGGKTSTSGYDRDGNGDDSEGEGTGSAAITLEELLERSGGVVEEAEEMEEEMWRRFSNMGFWRSPSRGKQEGEEDEECKAMQNSTLRNF
ncbi:hypothetical protein BT93_L1672 [Corymbia citriodora subsp. variegata]|uniref:Uncharacterized protein n=1 Tax=Corymbia citriodora subsp. variegata TaxID=360336 RepID=A0A8T0D044_CORYI|nr:hypothetical protein BT93_L1672 [Corymbia citriodora subsp. variegata]